MKILLFLLIGILLPFLAGLSIWTIGFILFVALMFGISELWNMIPYKYIEIIRIYSLIIGTLFTIIIMLYAIWMTGLEVLPWLWSLGK